MSDMHIRVVVVDDFPLLRTALAQALKADPAIEVVGEASSGEEALEVTFVTRPDVLLLDLHLPGLGGMAVLSRVRDELPDTRVLVVTASEKSDVFLEAVALGAAGYLTKRTTQRELINAVVAVHGGGCVVPGDMTGLLVREYRAAASSDSRGSSALRSLLAPREREVLRLLADGRTDREIGRTLYISPRTVQNHLARIREKTGLRRRSELSRWAVEHTWV